VRRNCNCDPLDVQHRIDLEVEIHSSAISNFLKLIHIRKALIAGEVYASDDPGESDDGVLFESLGIENHGHITFTWLEPELFFLNDTRFFSRIPELTIELNPQGARTSEIRGGLWDCIELRPRERGYELARASCWMSEVGRTNA
jgi:hypothetical protein